MYDFLKDAVHNLQINSLFKDRRDQWYKMRYVYKELVVV